MKDFDTPSLLKKQHEYSVVREERTSDESHGCRRETIEGYDQKGRLVAHGVYITHPDGSQGHVFKSVSSTGFWVGGFGLYDKDGNYLNGGTLAPEKFEEENL